MSAPNSLIELLRANIGKPLTSDLAADICCTVEPKRAAPIPAPEWFGGAATGPVSFQVERMADVVEEIRALHAAHWEETEQYRADVGLDVDYDQYIAVENAGAFLLVTARCDGELAGYFMFVLHTSRHSSKYVAAEDAFYLQPAFRRGFTFLRMLRFAEACLMRIGVKQITCSVKLTCDISPVMERAGYYHCAKLFTKVL